VGCQRAVSGRFQPSFLALTRPTRGAIEAMAQSKSLVYP